jgi:hypothetical protein
MEGLPEASSAELSEVGCGRVWTDVVHVDCAGWGEACQQGGSWGAAGGGPRAPCCSG